MGHYPRVPHMSCPTPLGLHLHAGCFRTVDEMDTAEEETKAMAALELPEQIIELSFHPHRDVIATGLLDGKVCLHKYAQAGHELALELSHHQASCRSVLFSDDGTALFTASKDRSIAAVGETGQVLWRLQGAHDWPVNTLHNVSDGILASGDDQGVIKIWDTRSKAEVVKFEVNSDFISDMTTNENGDKLLATSGDATLAVFDLKQRKLEGRVTNQEDELLSIQIMKNGSRVVCGTQDGVLVSWPWGTWGDRSSRFRGHPHSVDTLLKLDEDTVLTGSSDGIIRVVSVQPDKFLGLLGDHEDFPVESIKFSHDKSWIGSVSHDSRIRFWHAEYLFEEDSDEEQEEEQSEAKAGGEASNGKGPAVESATGMDTDSEGENDANEKDSDSSDDSDMGEGGSATNKSERKRKGKKGKKGQDRRAARAGLPSAAETFFADL